MQPIDLLPEDYVPTPPPPEIVERYGIAIVGCGGIAQHAHLPAYAKFGYRVVAACDLVEENARRAAETYNIPFWTRDLDEVLDRDDVDVIDLAVRPADRLALVERIAPSGKHILSQKALAPTFSEAQRIVEVCEDAGVTLMVNQQARWASYHKAMKVLIDRDVLGDLFSVVHLHRQNQDDPDSPDRDVPDVTMIDNGIHYVDLSRYFTGRTPSRVRAAASLKPGQYAKSPMMFTILCEYDPDDLMATLHFNNIATGLHHSPYLWFFDGAKASASIARHGPLGAGRTEITVAFADDPDYREVIDIQGQWSPDAWGGAMAEMLSALDERREPQTSGRDNLSSIRMTNAAVESYTTGRTVEVSEVS